MKIILLFFVFTALLSSQEQIKWKNEGSSSEIRVRYRLQNENKMLFLSIVNSQTMLQCYDYEKNELLSNFEANDAISINLSYDNSIFIINKDNANTLFRYNYLGEIINEYQLSNSLYHAIEYAENKVFTLMYENGVSKFVQYDLVNDEVIADLSSYDIKTISNNYYIDNKVFIGSLLKNSSRVTFTYDIEKNEFLSSIGSVSSLIRNSQVFENTIVTFHSERTGGEFTQFIKFLDRTTLDIIDSYNIITDEEYIEVLDETVPIAIRINSNAVVEQYDLGTGNVVKEVKRDFHHPHCIKLNDGFYYGYNYWGNFSYNIYDSDFNDLYGKLFPVPSNSHSGYAWGVRILGNSIISGAEDGSIIEWDFDGKLLKSPVKSNNMILAIDYSSKYNLVGIAYGIPKGKIEIYDASSWELKFEKDYSNNIYSISFNDEVDKFLIRGHENDIDVFDSENFNLINTIVTSKTTLPLDVPCSAILLDNSKLAYTYNQGLTICDYIENKILSNKQLYTISGLSPTMYLEKTKNKNEILVSGYNQSIFLVDYDLNTTDTISPNFTDVNGKNFLGFNKYKASFINDSLMYILGQQHLVVYNMNSESVVKDYNEMNPGGYINVGLRFLDFDFNSDIVTAVNNFGDVYGLVPYNIVTSVEKNITRDLIYPNPVKSEFKLDLDYFDEVKIFDLNGFIVKDIKQNSDKINITDIPAGVYYLQIKQNEEFIYSKLVKE